MLCLLIVCIEDTKWSALPNYYLSGNVDALPEVYCKLKNENIFFFEAKVAHNTIFILKLNTTFPACVALFTVSLPLAD